MLEASAACAPRDLEGRPGALQLRHRSKRDARQTVALIGDSHAVHWRAALQHVFKVHRWRGITIYRSQCPFTAARTSLAGARRLGLRAVEARHARLPERAPEIGTIFVSGNTGAGVVVPPGQNRFEVKTAGYMNAWGGLPASIQHIVVLRDPPHNRETTAACVERAIERRKPAGTTCQVPVATALAPDPAIEAAKRLNSPRVQAIDLTPFMCDAGQLLPRDRRRARAQGRRAHLDDVLDHARPVSPPRAERAHGRVVTDGRRQAAGRTVCRARALGR